MLEDIRDNDPQIASLPRENTAIEYLANQEDKRQPNILGSFVLAWGKISLTPEEQELVDRFNRLKHKHDMRPILGDDERAKIKDEFYELASIEIPFLDSNTLGVTVSVPKRKDGQVDYRLCVPNMRVKPIRFFSLDEVKDGQMDRLLSDCLTNPDRHIFSACVPMVAHAISRSHGNNFYTDVFTSPTR